MFHAALFYEPRPSIRPLVVKHEESSTPGQDAHYESERASNPITLMDMNSLVEAINEHYENMDLETRVLLPLRKIYWPV